MINTFYITFVISIIGSLPVGVLNTTATKIAVEHSIKHVIPFAIGVILVELIQAYISFVSTNWLSTHRAVQDGIQLLSVFIFIYLASVYYKKKDQINNSPETKRSKQFWLGLKLSALNPLAIPFWAFYVLLFSFSKETLPAFLVGVVLGTFFSLLLYALIGKLFRTKLLDFQTYFNKVIALVFLIIALYQTYNLIAHVTW